MRKLGAAKAKANFLSLLNEVEMKREGVIVTKNGRPVAQVIPMPYAQSDPIFGFYKGKLKIVGDIVSSPFTDEDLADFQQHSSALL